MKELSFKALREEQDRLEKRLKQICRAIESFQKLCEHDWVDDGHDSHHNWSKCSKCGDVECDI